MRILVTGAKGQLGTDLMDELSKRNIDLSDVFMLTSDDCGSINVVRKEKSK